MKTLFSRAASSLATIVLAAGMVLNGSAAAFATDSPTIKTTGDSSPSTTGEKPVANNQTPRVSGFCSEISSKTQSIVSSVTTHKSKSNDNWSQQNQKLSDAFTKVDQTVESGRATADAARSEDFQKLEAKASTDAQKQAVSAYEVAVKNAVAARRAAYDSARQTYRTSLESTIAAKHAAAAQLQATLLSQVNAAIATAVGSCATSPTSGDGIRATLQASLKSARESFTANAPKATGAADTQKQLASARNAAFAAAQQTFKSALDTARQNLQKAFNAQV